MYRGRVLYRAYRTIVRGRVAPVYCHPGRILTKEWRGDRFFFFIIVKFTIALPIPIANRVQRRTIAIVFDEPISARSRITIVLYARAVVVPGTRPVSRAARIVW